jgi:hypothetical protein
LSTLRGAIALLVGILVCTGLVVPFVLVINRTDWGVAMLLLAPLLVFVLLRISRRLECWARNEASSLPPDPDFPDDAQ